MRSWWWWNCCCCSTIDEKHFIEWWCACVGISFLFPFVFCLNLERYWLVDLIIYFRTPPQNKNRNSIWNRLNFINRTLNLQICQIHRNSMRGGIQAKSSTTWINDSDRFRIAQFCTYSMHIMCVLSMWMYIVFYFERYCSDILYCISSSARWSSSFIFVLNTLQTKWWAIWLLLKEQCKKER